MPRDGSGNYSLPSGYLATTGNTIVTSQHNPPFQDLATSVSNSLPVDGSKGMSGPLKASDGSASSPSITFGSNTTTGFFRKALNVIGIAVNGLEVGSIDSSGVLPSSTVVFTLKSVAPSGWLMFNDGTLGNSASGADYHAADALSVFTDIYNNISDANAPILTSTGVATTRSAQTNATTAWAANCRISLPKALGRALASAGAGSGLTSRALGDSAGAETFTIAKANLPSYNLTVSIPSGQGSHDHPLSESTSGAFTGGPAGGTSALISTSSTRNTQAATLPAMSGTAATGGSGTAINKVGPTTFLNTMIKL